MTSEVLHPVAWDIFPRSSNAAANFNNRIKLKQEVTEDGVRFSLPLLDLGFDVSGLEVKVEEGALKIKAKKEEKNAKGEIVATRMMRQTIALPEGCDADGMETSFEQGGVMAIFIPRKATAIPQVTQSENKEVTLEARSETQEVAHKTAKGTPSSDRILATIPVRGYRPEELSVKVIENARAVEVRGKHEERSEDGKIRSVSMQFSRTFALLEDVEVDKIQSSMSADGAELTVRAPVVTKPAVKKIPIQMEIEQSD